MAVRGRCDGAYGGIREAIDRSAWQWIEDCRKDGAAEIAETVYSQAADCAPHR